MDRSEATALILVDIYEELLQILQSSVVSTFVEKVRNNELVTLEVDGFGLLVYLFIGSGDVNVASPKQTGSV